MYDLWQGDASALEIAAEKMTSAVALLVQMEREIVELTDSGVCIILQENDINIGILDP